MCRNGETCRFRDQQTGVVDGCWFAHEPAKRRCREYALQGYCALQESCEFKHTLPDPPDTIDVEQIVMYGTVGVKILDERRVTYIRQLPPVNLPNELAMQIAKSKKDAVSVLTVLACRKSDRVCFVVIASLFTTNTMIVCFIKATLSLSTLTTSW